MVATLDPTFAMVLLLGLYEEQIDSNDGNKYEDGYLNKVLDLEATHCDERRFRRIFGNSDLSLARDKK